MLFALLRVLASALDLTQPAPCTQQWLVSHETATHQRATAPGGDWKSRGYGADSDLQSPASGQQEPATPGDACEAHGNRGKT